MALTKIKVTTGPIQFEMVGDTFQLHMPEGVTIEVEKEGDDLVSGGPLKFNIEDLVPGFGKPDEVSGD